MRRLMWVTVVGLVLVLGGCDEADPVGDELSTLGGSASTFVDVYCDCYTDSAAFNGNRAACEATFSTVRLEPCEEAAYRRFDDASPAFVRCGREALDGYTSCLRSCPSTSAELGVCSAAFDASNAACREAAPAGLLAELAACP